MTSPPDHPETALPTSPEGDEVNNPTPDAEAHRHVIAIDGPAAAGKTTVARALADRLGVIYLDTGLLYRGVTLLALRAGLPPSEGAAIAQLARNAHFDIHPPDTTFLSEQLVIDGENVTSLLRTPEIDRSVSAVSSHPDVRATLLPIQRRIAARQKVVMVGRDITTVVVPDAGLKIYLDASPAERARRRLAERAELGLPGNFDQMLREIEDRDLADSTRAVAPLQIGDDVTCIDSDGLSVDQVVDAIVALANPSPTRDST